MRCTRVESVLMEGMQEQSAAVQEQLQAHLKDCPQCEKFAEELQALHEDAAELVATEVPESLSVSVLSRCRSELRESARSFPGTVPVWVRACTGLLCLLTVLWAYPAIKDFVMEESVDYRTGLVITLVMQNAIMLLFAPLIVRIFKNRAQKSRYLFMYASRRN